MDSALDKETGCAGPRWFADIETLTSSNHHVKKIFTKM
jgi:hypothetical protein